MGFARQFVVLGMFCSPVAKACAGVLQYSHNLVQVQAGLQHFNLQAAYLKSTAIRSAVHHTTSQDRVKISGSIMSVKLSGTPQAPVSRSKRVENTYSGAATLAGRASDSRHLKRDSVSEIIQRPRRAGKNGRGS